jgi:hypothetical protein
MRDKLRIRPFLRRLDIPELIRGMYPADSDTELSRKIDTAVTLVNSADFINYWEDNPDLRFGQIMYNLNCNFFEPVYNHEESSVLQKCGWTEIKSTIFANELGAKFIDEYDSDSLIEILQEYGLSKKDHPDDIIALVIEELETRED